MSSPLRIQWERACKIMHVGMDRFVDTKYKEEAGEKISSKMYDI